MKKLFVILLLIFAWTIQAQEYRTHKVKSGETIEDIASRYMVTPYDIYGLNPDAKKELRVGSVLIIPKSKVETQAEKAIITKELSGFKEHKVKRKETLYSLSKEYEVDEAEIKKHNPHLYSKDLEKGETIKIPLYRKVIKVETPHSNTVPYTVLPKEGKWRVAYKFGITVNELETLNPNLGETLQEGQIIRVPNKENLDIKEVDEKYSYYTVLPKEGFYRLKLKLGLQQEELEALNPELKEGGLKEGMVLKIPYSAEAQSSSEEKTMAVTLENRVFSNNDTKHLVVMLPFRLNRVVMDSVSDTKKQIVSDPYLSNSLDFHSGILVALDSLKELGISLKVDVYDTKNEKNHINTLLRTHDFETVDAVIGPLLNDNFELVASQLKNENVPVVSPIGKNVNKYSNVFQSLPENDVLSNKMVDYVKTKKDSTHIIVISDSKNAAVRDKLKREFPTASLINSRKNKSGEDLNYVTKPDIESALRPGKNMVFLETESSGFVSNVTSILNAIINEETQIVLMTTNMNEAFKGDEVSNHDLSNLQFHFATIRRYNTDENSNGFVERYLEKYGDTPSKMATRGFDLTMDIVLRLVTSESLYTSVKEDELTEYVENKFSYKKELFGGYYNNSVYLVRYENLRIVEVNN